MPNKIISFKTFRKLFYQSLCLFLKGNKYIWINQRGWNSIKKVTPNYDKNLLVITKNGFIYRAILLKRSGYANGKCLAIRRSSMWLHLPDISKQVTHWEYS